jgi:hypothetical protein
MLCLIKSTGATRRREELLAFSKKKLESVIELLIEHCHFKGGL